MEARARESRAEWLRTFELAWILSLTPHIQVTPSGNPIGSYSKIFPDIFSYPFYYCHPAPWHYPFLPYYFSSLLTILPNSTLLAPLTSLFLHSSQSDPFKIEFLSCHYMLNQNLILKLAQKILCDLHSPLYNSHLSTILFAFFFLDYSFPWCTPTLSGTHFHCRTFPLAVLCGYPHGSSPPSFRFGSCVIFQPTPCLVIYI